MGVRAALRTTADSPTTGRGNVTEPMVIFLKRDTWYTKLHVTVVCCCLVDAEPTLLGRLNESISSSSQLKVLSLLPATCSKDWVMIVLLA